MRRTSRLGRRRGGLCKELEHGRPAAVDAFAHGFAPGRAHPFEIPMFELDPRASGGVGQKSHLNLGRESRARIRFPFRADLPTDDEALAGPPDEYVPYDGLGAVLKLGVPPATFKRFDNGFPDRRSTDALGLRPPAIDPRGEHLEGSLRRRLDNHGLAHRRDADRAIHGFSTSFLNASSASLQNSSSQRRRSPSPSGSMLYTRRVPWARSTTSPARFSALRCCDTAGRLTGKSSATSPTDAAPRRKRSNTARRVGSASALKVVP